ncbi:MAG: DUF4037 domain-containing protein [Lachnospiraceae bacterium]|nr:DUF4037 domain-containing protein [Lachnospiraceae bacterium]
MNGLGLAEKYYFDIGRRPLLDACPDVPGWAAGLAGEGSDCLGFDDEISRDHDWGPGFCIWLNDEDFSRYGEALQAAYDSLPAEFMGFIRENMPLAGRRVGVFSTSDYYKRFLGRPGLPATNFEWLNIPEEYLAVAVSGKVFEVYGKDAGFESSFCAVREGILNFYPEDVRRKKIAADLARMAREGQYNYWRCLERGEAAAAYMALSGYISSAIKAIYLLKKRYAPYYKWALRGLREVPGCSEFCSIIDRLVSAPSDMAALSDANVRERKLALIEEIAGEIIGELSAQGLSRGKESFLQSHAEEVLAGISDKELKSIHILAG